MKKNLSSQDIEQYKQILENKIGFTLSYSSILPALASKFKAENEEIINHMLEWLGYSSEVFEQETFINHEFKQQGRIKILNSILTNVLWQNGFEENIPINDIKNIK